MGLVGGQQPRKSRSSEPEKSMNYLLRGPEGGCGSRLLKETVNLEGVVEKIALLDQLPRRSVKEKGVDYGCHDPVKADKMGQKSEIGRLGLSDVGKWIDWLEFART